MKKITAFAVMLCLALAAISQTSRTALFLGNSYTGANNLPLLVSQLAQAAGDTLVYDSNTPGGYTLEGHSTNATSLSKISSRGWDYVIMQEQSQRPSFSPAQVAQQVFPYAAILCDSIRANDVCTEPMFYMTWGRKNGDQQNCQFYPPVCTYEGMQGRLRASYMQMSQDNQCTVAPAGVAWWEARLRDPAIELYTADESHPNYRGSYLTGCVFYASIFRKSPLGIPFYGSLDSAGATFLQQVAHDVVFDSLAQWRIGANDVLADWSWTANGGAVDFMDQSVNAGQHHWDFGDGDSSALATPSHSYAATGDYLVTLIVTDGCTSDTLSDTVSVVVVGLEAGWDTQVSIYPNPGEGHIRVSASEAVEAFEVLDLQGRVLGAGIPSGREWDLDLGALPSGTYLLRLRREGGVSSHIIRLSR